MNEVWYRQVSYEDAKDLVKESLSNTVGAFITAGYWLKYIREKKEYEKEGYSSLWEMAEKEFGLKESEASRAMRMNDKYSLDGNSPFMLEKYCGYNKSQLQEMLTMTEEQLEQVATDMKVHQMRQLKKTGATEEQLLTLKEFLGLWVKEVYVDICECRNPEENIEKQIEKLLEESVPVKIGHEVFFAGDDVDELVERTTGEVIAKYSKGVAVAMVLEGYRKLQEVRGTKKKPELRGMMDDPYCGECGAPLNGPEDGGDTDIICFRCGQAVDWSCYPVEEPVAMSQEPVITGCEVVFEEEISATDAQVEQEIIEDVENVLLEAEIVEEIEYEEEEVAAVLEFEVLDDKEKPEIIIDGEFRELSEEEIEPEEVALEIESEENTVAAVEESELSQVKRILEKEKELLSEYLKIDDFPVFTVKRQKIIVGALANMLCELEAVEQKAELAEQPKLPILKNNDQRQEFIADYEKWQVWMEQPLTGEKYYRYEFENGTAFVVKAYFHKCFDYNARGKWEDRYKDGWGAEEYYIITEGKYFKDCLTNKSCMIEFLKTLQKGENR